MKRILYILGLLCVTVIKLYGQTSIQVFATFQPDKNRMLVEQKILIENQIQQPILKIYLNDWNHSFSGKDTPLAKRFSDEFIRNFHLSKNSEKGFTSLKSLEIKEQEITWCRLPNQVDIVEITLNKPLAPGEKATILLHYDIILPKTKFTGFGQNAPDFFAYRNSFITPAFFSEKDQVKYSHLNIDDNAAEPFTSEVKVVYPSNYHFTSDMQVTEQTFEESYAVKKLVGKNKRDIQMFFTKKAVFSSHKNQKLEVAYNIQDKKLNAIQKALIIDRIVHYTDSVIGKYPHPKILVTQQDYDKNPFYGLNQLPSFISPFADDFVFEIKFLKTFLNTYLKNSLQLDQRKYNWIYDAIQVYVMMDYIEKYYPDEKMLGNVSNLKLLKGYYLTKLKFNQQYSYYYLLMARKNLDQAIGDSKETLLKFNEQIAGKYRAGLSLKYLDDYLKEEKVGSSVQNFYAKGSKQKVTEQHFEEILRSKTSENLDWYFQTIIHSRDWIDFKIQTLEKKNDSIYLLLKNKTKSKVPVPIYTLKNDSIQSKQWIRFQRDTVVKFPNQSIDKIVLNYENEVPEYNLRNNWKATNGFLFKNRPLKVNLFRDIENPYNNQLLYIPTFSYNIYNGAMLGLRIHNRTFLDKAFRFTLNPEYALGTRDLNGSFGMELNEIERESNWFNTSLYMGGKISNFAPDAKFYRFTPSIVFRWRPEDFRSNHSQRILARYVLINREPSEFVNVTESTVNYSLLNVRFNNIKSELIHHKGFNVDLQLGNIFGKVSTEFEYRKLFPDNRLLSVRAYAGTFLYRNTTSEFFSFGLDRPTDYLFDYNFLGVSETSGFWSQQFVMAEGGFKSVLPVRYANQWISTLNVSYSIWNWVEAYGDIGLLKNHNSNAVFQYDSGIRLNFLPDYFELYFPIYSNNGWEWNRGKYAEKIRFVVTLEPSRLTSLFTRKWF